MTPPSIGPVVGRFMLDFYRLVYRWANWADGIVGDWPANPTQAEPDWAVMEDIVGSGDEVLRQESVRRRRIS